MLTIYIVSTGHHEFLSKAIKSVLVCASNISILVIETSSDEKNILKSSQIVEKLGLSLLNLPNYKLPEVANHVLGIVNTTYLMRLDADDWLAGDFFQVARGYLELNSFDAYIPSYIEIDREENHLREVCRSQLSVSKIKDNPPHGACTIFRVDFLREIGGYSSSYDRQDGYYMWLKVLRYGTFMCMPNAKFYYRQHGGNLTSDQRELWNVRASMLVDECFEEIRGISYCIIPIVSLDTLFGQITMQPFMGYATLLEYELSKLVIGCEVVVYGPASLADILPSHVRHIERLLFSSDQWADIEQEVIDELKVKEGYICVKNIEYPFVNPKYIEAAISAVHLFDANSCITVEELKRDIYYSSDSGLILAESGAVQDNDRSYRRSGGVVARRIKKGRVTVDSLITSLPADTISSIRVTEIKDFADLQGLFK